MHVICNMHVESDGNMQQKVLMYYSMIVSCNILVALKYVTRKQTNAESKE